MLPTVSSAVTAVRRELQMKHYQIRLLLNKLGILATDAFTDDYFKHFHEDQGALFADACLQQNHSCNNSDRMYRTACAFIEAPYAPCSTGHLRLHPMLQIP